MYKLAARVFSRQCPTPTGAPPWGRQPRLRGPPKPPDPPNAFRSSFKDKLLQWHTGVSPYRANDGFKLEASDIRVEMKEGGPSFRFSECFQSHIACPWVFSVITKVLGRHFSYRVICSKVASLWKPQGGTQVIDLANDYYLVRFERKEDYTRAMAEGPWTIQGSYLTAPSVEQQKSSTDPVEVRVVNQVTTKGSGEALGSKFGAWMKVSRQFRPTVPRNSGKAVGATLTANPFELGSATTLLTEVMRDAADAPSSPVSQSVQSVYTLSHGHAKPVVISPRLPNNGDDMDIQEEQVEAVPLVLKRKVQFSKVVPTATVASTEAGIPKQFQKANPRISSNTTDRVIRTLGFQGWVREDARGFAGGIWILWRPETQEGAPVNLNRLARFQDWIEECRLTDLGFKGPRFTWFRGLLRHRLDRIRRDGCYNACELGDRNTHFFHLTTKGRRQKNRIEALQTETGEWVVFRMLIMHC
ncbi:hypothetical protein Tsubulata_042360 [Turnera subulata]|uniref:DUF4283 domain-containing protein n=1 Tax=Turnera subulata TaxID=218843 RepID=A0A9Q0FHV5_9ROSI|nr:hypothetical protein Tsubulata_042360 [Turnera subulata]